MGGKDCTISTAVLEAGYAEIFVADCGMSAEVRRQAFDPFFTTRHHLGSTGLGLHILHNIVTNRLGGRLDLESSPGAGTKFQIILPRNRWLNMLVFAAVHESVVGPSRHFVTAQWVGRFRGKADIETRRVGRKWP
jgi:chemotaxis protein histidine kinase CheA